MTQPLPWLTRVRIKNYRSIAECDVTLSPLTVLVGPNGSGKSNFLDALRLLSDAVATTPYQAVDTHGGLTAIGELDDASQTILREKRFTLGELMRSSQLAPRDAV
jgi:predicted ATPase